MTFLAFFPQEKKLGYENKPNEKYKNNVITVARLSWCQYKILCNTLPTLSFSIIQITVHTFLQFSIYLTSTYA